MVLSWATPPPLSRNERAASPSSTSGLRPLRSRPIVVVRQAPLPRLRRRRELNELLAKEAGVPDVAQAFSASRRRSAPRARPRRLALEVDRLDLPDRDVVDLDGRLGHQVVHVAEPALDCIESSPIQRRQAAAGRRPRTRRSTPVEGDRPAARRRETRRSGRREGASSVALLEPGERPVGALRASTAWSRGSPERRGCDGSGNTPSTSQESAGLPPCRRMRRAPAGPSSSGLDVLPDVVARVEGPGPRVAGKEQVVERQRGVAKSLLERVTPLDEDLGDVVEAGDVPAQGVRSGRQNRIPAGWRHTGC